MERPEAADYQLMQSMFRQAAELTATAPLILAIDDAQHTDEQSARWLDFLLRRSVRLPLLVVLALGARQGVGKDFGKDTDAPPAAGQALADLLAGRQPLAIDLGPLAEPEILGMIQKALGAPVHPEFLKRAAACTGGNPRLLEELLTRLRTRALPADRAAADKVDELSSDIVLSMIDVMLAWRTPNLIEAAEAIAVLGPAKAEVVAALAGIPFAAVEPAVEALRTADVLVGSPADYRLDIVRAAVLANLGYGRSERLRERAANLLLSSGSPSEHVARQLIATTERFDALTVAGQLPQLYLGTRPDQAEIQIRLAQSLADAEPFGAVDMLRTVLARHPDMRTRAGLAVRFVVAYLSVRRRCPAALPMAEMLDSLETELAAGNGRTDPALATLVDVTRLLARSTDPVALVDAHARIAVIAAAPVDAPTQRQLLAMLTATAATQAPSVPLALTQARRALAIPGVLPGWATLRSALTVSYSGEIAEAVRTLERALAYNTENAVIWNQVHVLAVRALIRLDTGAVPEALADARQAMAEANEQSWGDRVTLPRIVLAMALAENDRTMVETAQALLAEIYQPTMSNKDGKAQADILAVWYFNAQTRVCTVAGQLEAALANAMACGRLITESGWQHSIFVAWWAHAAWLLAELGRPDEAGDLVAHGTDMAQAWRTPRARGLSLLAAGVTYGGQTGVRLLTEAVAELSASPARGDHAWAHYLLGRALLAGGDTAAAREALRLTVDQAARCGRYGLVAAARSALVVAGGRNRAAGTSSTAVLTDRERRIAELAARGVSNQRIAESLFVTVRTVEHHLTSVYRKLGLQRRAQLGRALVRYDHVRDEHLRPAPDGSGSAR